MYEWEQGIDEWAKYVIWARLTVEAEKIEVELTRCC